MCFDKADYYFGKAMKAYCQAYQKKEGALTGEDHDEIFRWAGRSEEHTSELQSP